MSSRAFQFRCLALCSIFVIGLSALSVRLIQIQVWDRKEYASHAARAFDRIEKLPGLRGKIVDRNEEVLAKSMPVSSVFVDVQHFADPKVMAFTVAYDRVSRMPGWEELDARKRVQRVQAERWEILSGTAPEKVAGLVREQALACIVQALARPMGMLREDLRNRILSGIGDRSSGELLLAKNVPEDIARGIREVIEENWIEGVFLRGTHRRWYTAPNLATHVTGYTGEIEEKNENEKKPVYRQVGKFGVEAALESYLAGRDGWREYRRDRSGMRIPGDSSSILPPRAGLNVQLTLDMSVQAIVEEELDWCLAEFKAPRGCAIVLDPKTGEILGMASRPHFNLNRLDNLDEAGMNFALQAMYEPGSTIKVVAAAAALNERLVSPTTMINCHNGYFRDGAVEVRDDYPKGTISFETVLQTSNNIGTYMLGRQVGLNRFYRYMDDFGFGRRTGIMLSGEAPGRVRNTGNAVDFSRATYGYATAVTPLQMTSAFGVLAHDGKLRQPHIVRSVIANDGTVVEQYEPEVVRDVLRPETARAMRRALEKVTGEGGTAKQARVPGFRVACKTGTARRIANGRYQERRYTVSLAGMLPAEDPAFVCVVVIDDPRTTEVRHYGGTIAAPCFARIASRTAAHLNLTPTEPVDDKLAGAPQP